MPTLVKQLRRIKLPLDALVEFIDRRSESLSDVRFHHGSIDEKNRQVFLYIETGNEQDPTQPVPVDLEINWKEIFGTITCPTCGNETPVEDIVSCVTCASKAAPVFSASNVQMISSISWRGCAAGNYGTGRLARKPEAIVIHVMDGTLEGTTSLFLTPPAGRKPPLYNFASSAHYGIGKDGKVYQYVREEDRAYHAGRILDPTWNLLGHGDLNPNLYTIGIEHEGTGESEWPDKMLDSSASLIRQICQRWSIPIDRQHIVGHREIYAGKNCPGKCPLDDLVKRAQTI